jgi:prevent-host-death family protein
MKIAPLAKVKDQFSAYIEACKESPVVVTKNGKPVAMIVPIEDEDDLDSLLLAHNPRFLQILEDGYRSVKETGGIKSQEFWAEIKRRRRTKKKAA